MSQLTLLHTILKSRMKAQEFFLLLKNKKPVIRHGYYDDEANMILALCNELRLNLVKSTFAVSLVESGFANKGEKGDEGMCFYYISKDPNLAVAAKEAEEANDHRLLGKLLDYPPCCTQFFTKTFSESQTNPQHTPTKWETNLIRRVDDWCVLSHFPCTNECRHSVDLANRYYVTIADDNLRWAKQLKKALADFSFNDSV